MLVYLGSSCRNIKVACVLVISCSLLLYQNQHGKNHHFFFDMLSTIYVPTIYHTQVVKANFTSGNLELPCSYYVVLKEPFRSVGETLNFFGNDFIMIQSYSGRSINFNDSNCKSLNTHLNILTWKYNSDHRFGNYITDYVNSSTSVCLC